MITYSIEAYDFPQLKEMLNGNYFLLLGKDHHVTKYHVTTMI